MDQLECQIEVPLPNRRPRARATTRAFALVGSPRRIALHCAKCGQLFTIALRPTQRKPPALPEKVIVLCPYPNCEGKMEPPLYADVLGIWTGDALKR